MRTMGLIQRDHKTWVKLWKRIKQLFRGPAHPFAIRFWHPYNLWLSLPFLAELAGVPFGQLAFQHTLFLSPQACCLPIGNYILWASSLTFYIYIWSVLSALSNPMFLPRCTVPLLVIAQGFAELTLLLFSVPTSPHRSLTFQWCPFSYIKISCQRFVSTISTCGQSEVLLLFQLLI